MSEHLARHTLEELAIDEARVAPELRSHLAACAHCSGRLRNIEQARAQHALEHPANDFARRVIAARAARNPSRGVPRRVHLYWGLLGGALAMLAVAFVLRAASKPEIRYRGTAVSLQVYVRSGTATRVLREGESLAAGTQLAFTYSLAEPQHLLLFGVDDGGTITAYFPDGNIAHGSLLEAGDTRQLPVGIELDARRGRERLIALFSETALDDARARTAIEAAWRRARAQGKGLSEPFEVAVPARQISLWFEKP